LSSYRQSYTWASVLAKERDATLLVDEREARRVALQLGIGYIGSLSMQDKKGQWYH
jgi:predicted nucleic acid-binding protein